MKFIDKIKSMSRKGKTILISTVSGVLVVALVGTSVGVWLFNKPTAAPTVIPTETTSSQDSKDADKTTSSESIVSATSSEAATAQESSESADDTASTSSAAASKPASNVSSSTAKPNSTSSTAKPSGGTSSTAKPSGGSTKPSSSTASSAAPTPSTPAPTQLVVPNAAQLQIIATEITRLTNAYRVQKGLAAFKTHNLLNQAAAIRGKEQLKQYGHNRPDGRDYATVFRDLNVYDEYNFSKYPGIEFGSIGENAARQSSYSPVTWTTAKCKEFAQAIVTAWKNSNGHNANMLKNKTYMGVGCSAQIETNNSGEKFIAVYGLQLFTN